MEKEVLVFIYKRKKIKADDEVESYTYEPSEILHGKEVDYDGNKIFMDDSGKFNYPFIDDIYNFDDEYVYAFPAYLDGLSEGQKSKLTKTLKREAEDFDKHLLFQLYTPGEAAVETFASSDGLETQISVNPESYEGFEEMVNSEYTREVKRLKQEIAVTEEEIKRRKESPTIIVPKIIYADELYKAVSRTVICQDEQIKKIATSVAKNQRLQDTSLKSNMLICGPTGVGKTEIFRTISKKTDLPITIEDSTEYTAASYKGKDVTEMLLHLYENSGKDIERAQRGIVVVDEIDKKVSKGDHATFTSAVIQSLLKMMEGHKYQLISPDDKGIITFDTSKLTFAFLGAFSGIEEYSRTKRGIGFNTSKEESQDNKEIFNNETLKKFGLLPEFVGRNDNIVVMNSLDTEEYMRIIKESDKSQLLLYRKFFESIGIDFKYDERTIEEIAIEAKKLGIGARGIKRIVENALEVANYYALSEGQHRELIISPETIHDSKQYILK